MGRKESAREVLITRRRALGKHIYPLNSDGTDGKSRHLSRFWKFKCRRLRVRARLGEILDTLGTTLYAAFSKEIFALDGARTKTYTHTHTRCVSGIFEESSLEKCRTRRCIIGCARAHAIERFESVFRRSHCNSLSRTASCTHRSVPALRNQNNQHCSAVGSGTTATSHVYARRTARIENILRTAKCYHARALQFKVPTVSPREPVVTSAPRLIYISAISARDKRTAIRVIRSRTEDYDDDDDDNDATSGRGAENARERARG